MACLSISRRVAIIIAIGCLPSLASPARAQSRVTYNNQQLFLSGSNVAWVNWASDIGPGATNFAAFRDMFDSLHACGGNAMRLWLHTTGATTPQFNTSGIVIGPGTNAIADLDSILDIAWRRKVGLMLCLWSFDMLRTANGTGITDRARLMLTDAGALQAYIDKALIPMVTALKGHPGILAWEVFNEAEGMSNEFGWDFTLHVPMADIQRFVNRVAGAIHRTDSTAQVTTGAWSFMALSDVTDPAKKADLESVLASMTTAEKQKIEDDFAARYQARLSVESILSPFMLPANINYYRDDRLVAAGGDPDGTLDFHTVHYYTWAGTALSPFHHSCESWGLTKPLVLAEFYLEQSFGVLYSDMYRNLMAGGYAGALTWQWYQNNTQQPRTKEVMRDLFNEYPAEVDVAPTSGKIYSFHAAPPAIEAGESSTLRWNTTVGSTVTLDGHAVALRDSLVVSPAATSTYTLIARGLESDTISVTVQVYPTGKILSFTASPAVIGPGEKCRLMWRTAPGSTVTLDGVPVGEDDSMMVQPDSTTRYVLAASGEVRDTTTISVTVRAVHQINRALAKPITVSSNSDDTQLGVPRHIVDGNYATQWGSLAHEAQWAIVDLGESFRVSRVVITWGSKYAKIYRLGISPDNKAWTLLQGNSAGNGGTDEIDSLDGRGRYLKLLMDKSLALQGYTVREIEIFGIPEGSSAAEYDPREIPGEFRLEQNYPNPFNPRTVVSSQLPVASDVRIVVYDLLGREVAVLVDGWRAAGRYQDTFSAEGRLSVGPWRHRRHETLGPEGRSRQGSASGGDAIGLASGVYIYRMTTGSFIQSRTMLLLK